MYPADAGRRIPRFSFADVSYYYQLHMRSYEAPNGCNVHVLRFSSFTY